jgi:hypothetical protein
VLGVAMAATVTAITVRRSNAVIGTSLIRGSNADADHQRTEKRLRLAQRQGQRARHPGADHRHRLVRGRASDLIYS